MGAAVELNNEKIRVKSIYQSKAGEYYLSDVHHVVLVLEHRGLVIVDIQVVGGREDSDQGGEPRGLTLSVHSVARVLGLVRTND